MKEVKNAIITGAGRNTGIGAEICRTLSQKGLNIYFTSDEGYDSSIGQIEKSDYNKTLHECSSFGVQAFFQPFDLSNNKGIKALFIDATKRLGHIDILVNCVCYHKYDSLDKITSEMLDANFNINAKAVLQLCQEFYLRFSGDYGRIVNLSSTQNLEALISEIAYAITKASVPVITSTIAPILAKKRITINAVNPGPTDIGINEKVNELYFRNNLFGRLGTPKDVANLIAFLVSEEGKWITGQTINSEGGIFRGNFKYNDI